MTPSEQIEEYILRHIEPEGEYLHRLWRATNIHLLRGRMASGHLQGRVLKMLVQMIRPQRILEVGTFSGYSAICMAEGLEDGGRVYTFEINDEQEDFTRPWIEGSAVADKITFIIGDAIEEAPRLQYAVGRPCGGSCLLPRRPDTGHRVVQRLCGARRPRGTGDTAPPRRTHHHARAMTKTAKAPEATNFRRLGIQGQVRITYIRLPSSARPPCPTSPTCPYPSAWCCPLRNRHAACP